MLLLCSYDFRLPTYVIRIYIHTSFVVPSPGTSYKRVPGTRYQVPGTKMIIRVKPKQTSSKKVRQQVNNKLRLPPEKNGCGTNFSRNKEKTYLTHFNSSCTAVVVVVLHCSDQKRPRKKKSILHIYATHRFLLLQLSGCMRAKTENKEVRQGKSPSCHVFTGICR